MHFNKADFSELDPESLEKIAREQGEKFVRLRIKTNQIRNIYSTVSKIRNDFHLKSKTFSEEIRRELIMLKPKLAYAAGKNEEVRPFQELFDEAISGITSSKNPAKALENFFFLAEAVVAYHKYFGGKDN